MKEFAGDMRRSIVFPTLTCLAAVCIVSTGLFLTSFSAAAAEKATDKSHSADIQTPVFTPNGTIVCGAKSVWKKEGWSNVLMCLDNDTIGTLFELLDLGKGGLNPIYFKNSKNELIGNSSVYTAEVRDEFKSDKKLGTYKLSVTLLDDGLIRIESTCVLDNPSLLKTRYSTFDFPPYLRLSGEYVKGEKIVSFDDKKPVSFSADDLKGAVLRFFPGSNEKSFTIYPEGYSEIRITPSVKINPEGAGSSVANAITFTANRDGVVGFLLDIRGSQTAKDTSQLSPNGINFWEVDNLHFPDYGASRNLILNPSFEAGLRYWGYPGFTTDIIPLKYQNFYELDDKVAHSGSHSLRIKAMPFRCPQPLGPFAIPFVSGKQYTLSFYAKGSTDKKLVVALWGRQFRGGDTLFSKSVTKFDINNEWKRYSTPVVPSDLFGGIYFRAHQKSAASEMKDDFDMHSGRVQNRRLQLIAASDQKEETVWLDDIQLEEGEMTDFTQAPMAVQMVSSARGNFLKFGQKPDFKLLIESRPDSEGTVSFAVEDFFFKKIFEDTYKFKTDSTGKSSITLDKLSNQISNNKLRGVFAVSSVFKISGIDRPYKDYFRFSVMDFLDNTQKNKNLFTLFYVYTIQEGGPDMERFLERERAIGFGSFSMEFGGFANDLDYGLDEERMKLTAKYGISPTGGRGVVNHHDAGFPVHGQISEENEQILMTHIMDRVNPTDEELAVFENICAVKAAKRPWNTIWFFTGESNPGSEPLEGDPNSFAKFLLATLRGIKKGNPNAKVLIEGGPWNMDPARGTKWVEGYIQDTKRLDPNARFDGAAAHHYRNFPENPDLDSDIAAFLAMLDRNGCKDWPFYVNEGGNYCPFNIPQLGVSPYICHSANSWYFGPLSYHFGKAERIASAYSARNWLVALKYQDRVACMQDFKTPNLYMDFDFSPRIYDKMPNTLGRLLGNASFYKDIRFAPYTRCYVFKEDKTGSPIAAIWGYKESVDRWKEDAPLYTFDFGKQSVTFIDLMENEVSYPKGTDGRTVLTMSPFPLFIKGQPGTEEALCTAISNGIAASDAGTVQISAYPTASGQAAVIFKNPVSKEFKGQAKLTLNGLESQIPLELSALAQKQETLGVRPTSFDYGRRLPFDFSYSVNGAAVKQISGSYMLLKNNPGLSVEGNISDWKALSATDCGEGILVRTAVSNGNLLMAVEAKGQNPDIFTGTGLYVDPFGKTDQWNLARAVTQDLAVFEFVKSADGSLAAYCHYVQGTQAGSGSSYLVMGGIQKRITVKTFKSDDAAWLVFSVPQEVLSPLILKPDNRFGLNLAVPLKNGVRTLAPIRGFKKAAEPGESHLMTAIICD